MMRRVVVLPAPLGPSRPKIWLRRRHTHRAGQCSMARLAADNGAHQRAEVMLFAAQVPGAVAEVAETDLGGDVDVSGPPVHGWLGYRVVIDCRELAFKSWPESQGRRFFYGRRFAAEPRGRKSAVLPCPSRGA